MRSLSDGLAAGGQGQFAVPLPHITFYFGTVFDPPRDGRVRVVILGNLRITIARRILLYVSLLASFLVALWVATMLYLILIESNQRQQALTHSAQTIKEGTEAEIERYATAGRILAVSPSLARDDIAEFENEALQATKALGDAWVLLALPAGQQLFNTRVPHGAPNVIRSSGGLEA